MSNSPYPKSRLPGPITRLFELELARKLALGQEDDDDSPDPDQDETIRVSFENETVRVNASTQNVLIEECRRE